MSRALPKTIDDLKADPKNPRQITPEALAALRFSLGEFGDLSGLVWNRRTGTLVCGHQRLEALKREHGDKLTVVDRGVEVRLLVKGKPKFDFLVRIVDWEDSYALAANVAANSPQLAGDFSEGLDAVLGQIDRDCADLVKPLRFEDLAGMAGVNDGETDPDDIPEASEAITKSGDLYILGDHRLLCGDARDGSDVARLMDGSNIAVAVTSPPYASQREYDESSGFKPIPPDEYVEWFDAVQGCVRDHLADDGSWFVNIKENCEDGQRVLYVKDLTIAHVRQWGWLFVDELVWVHGGTPGKAVNRFKNGWEPIFHFARARHKFNPDSVRRESDSAIDLGFKKSGQIGKSGHPCDTGKHGETFRVRGLKRNRMGGRVSDNQGVSNVIPSGDVSGMAYPSNVLSLGRNREALGHGAAYPVALPEFFAKAYSDEGDILYDPFLGSGSTMIAAQRTDRRCFGMEISPSYCDITVKRWEAFTGQTAERVETRATEPCQPTRS